jgi:D-serine deaminase-like pyridoxal phosphate-dependent protein
MMLDSAAAAAQLAEVAAEIGRTVDVLVELDVGMRRTGVADADAAVTLAREVTEHAALRLAGIGFYPGHVRASVSEQGPSLAQVARQVDAALEALAHAGLPAETVSGGSTPAAWRMHEVTGLTEVRPGTYVYNDRVTAALGACEWDECALTVLATVVSTAVPGQAVIDAGSKTLGREPIDAARVGSALGAVESNAAAGGWGVLLDQPEVVVTRMSEEHGILDTSRSDWRPRVGEQVRVVPNHVCYVVALSDVVYGVRRDVVETRWPVAARGREEPSAVPAW